MKQNLLLLFIITALFATPTKESALALFTEKLEESGNFESITLNSDQSELELVSEGLEFNGTVFITSVTIMNIIDDFTDERFTKNATISITLDTTTDVVNYSKHSGIWMAVSQNLNLLYNSETESWETTREAYADFKPKGFQGFMFQYDNFLALFIGVFLIWTLFSSRRGNAILKKSNTSMDEAKILQERSLKHMEMGERSMELTEKHMQAQVEHMKRVEKLLEEIRDSRISR